MPSAFLWVYVELDFQYCRGNHCVCGSPLLVTGFRPKKAHGEALRKIENKGGQYVFYARVLPFFPTSILNILAAVTTISLKGFVAGTAAGNFLYFFVLSLIPFGFLSTDINPILIVLIILAVTVVVYFIQKQKK